MLRIAKLISNCSPEKIFELGGWDFGQNKPTNENEKFWETTDLDYFQKHLPKRGDYSGTYSRDQKYRFYLDFIKLERRAVEIVNGEESRYNQSFKQCTKL